MPGRLLRRVVVQGDGVVHVGGAHRRRTRAPRAAGTSAAPQLARLHHRGLVPLGVGVAAAERRRHACPPPCSRRAAARWSPARAAVAVPFTFTKWSRSPGTRRLSRYWTWSASPTQSGSEAATERSPAPRVRVVVGVRLERLPAAPAPAVAAHPHGHARLGAAAPAQPDEVEAARGAQRRGRPPGPRWRPTRWALRGRELEVHRDRAASAPR